MFPFPDSAQKLIIAPLNWGLGHATRSIPLIQQCINENRNVIIASDGEALELLKETFPQLPTIELPSYNVRYRGSSLLSIVAGNFFNILIAIIKEHFALKKIIKKYNPDLLVSDSRFGFWSKQVSCYFTTHQLNLYSKNKILRHLLNIVNTFFLKRFNHIWVFDTVNRSLSGSLSKNKLFNDVTFIGPVTRLKKMDLEIKYDIAIILSGPEPARTKLETRLVKLLSNQDLKLIFVRGTQVLSNNSFPHNWIVKNRIGIDEMNDVISSSRTVISRSGYTSIMDYYLLEKPAILIPTPGQSEQEYLANFLNGKFGFDCLTEENLNLAQLEKLLN